MWGLGCPPGRDQFELDGSGTHMATGTTATGGQEHRWHVPDFYLPRHGAASARGNRLIIIRGLAVGAAYPCPLGLARLGNFCRATSRHRRPESPSGAVHVTGSSPAAPYDHGESDINGARCLATFGKAIKELPNERKRLVCTLGHCAERCEVKQ